MNCQELTEELFDASLKMHHELDNSLFENAFEEYAVYNLRHKTADVYYQRPLKVYYEDEPLPKHFTSDLLVEKDLLVELKLSEALDLTLEHEQDSFFTWAKKQLMLFLRNPVQSIKGKIYRVAYDIGLLKHQQTKNILSKCVQNLKKSVTVDD
ncbi:MAG: GxxExxY protein [Bacteroidota bacterium]